MQRGDRLDDAVGGRIEQADEPDEGQPSKRGLVRLGDVAAREGQHVQTVARQRPVDREQPALASEWKRLPSAVGELVRAEREHAERRALHGRPWVDLRGA